MKKCIAILIIAAFLPFPTFAVTGAEIEQAKAFVKTSQGQELLKSPQGQQALGELSKQNAAPERPKTSVAAADLQPEMSGIESAFGKDLKLYGYDLFQDAASTFLPSGDVPVGPDYIIGPGDSFNLTLWGVAEGVFKVEVDRQGNIVLPKVGVVPVAGLTYGDLKPALERELAKYFEKINVGISIANLRTIRVFVVGEVAHPGSYSISSLSTLFTSLFAAGGSTRNGTLRKIELIRGNRTIATLDLYKFLLKGDKAQDRTLQSGDTIFVPLIGPTAGIAGSVYRPALYELKGETDLSELLALAGGVLPTGDLNRVQIERVLKHDKKVILDKKIELASKSIQLGIPIKNMDFVNLFPIYSAIGNVIRLEGNVKNPGPYEFKEDMRLNDILPSAKLLTFSAYLPKAEIVRTDKENLLPIIIEVNLQKLFQGDESQNPKLEAGDRIIVASQIKDPEQVEIVGEVKLPGKYILSPGERISSLLERARGFTPNAYLFGAILTRNSVGISQNKTMNKLMQNMERSSLRRERDQSSQENNAALLNQLKGEAMDGRIVLKLDYPEKIKGTKDDLALEDGDKIVIPKISKTVNVIGEVYMSGTLIYDADKNLSDYLKLVGGFTSLADQGGFYILKANGQIYSMEQGYNLSGAKLDPGDSIIVPQKKDQINGFAEIASLTKWLYDAVIAYSVIRVALK